MRKPVYHVLLFALFCMFSISFVNAATFKSGSSVEVTTAKARFLCTYMPVIRADGWNEKVGMYFPNDEGVITQQRDCTVPMTDSILSVVVYSQNGLGEKVVCDPKGFVPAYLTGCVS